MKEGMVGPAACWVWGRLAEGVWVEDHYGIPGTKVPIEYWAVFPFSTSSAPCWSPMWCPLPCRLPKIQRNSLCSLRLSLVVEQPSRNPRPPPPPPLHPRPPPSCGRQHCPPSSPSWTPLCRSCQGPPLSSCSHRLSSSAKPQSGGGQFLGEGLGLHCECWGKFHCYLRCYCCIDDIIVIDFYLWNVFCKLAVSCLAVTGTLGDEARVLDILIMWNR